MRIPIRKEGTSLVLELPVEAFEHCSYEDTVDADILNGAILIKPVNSRCRSDWIKSLKNMKEKGVDNLLIEEPSLVKMDDWEW